MDPDSRRAVVIPAVSGVPPNFTRSHGGCRHAVIDRVDVKIVGPYGTLMADEHEPAGNLSRIERDIKHDRKRCPIRCAGKGAKELRERESTRQPHYPLPDGRTEGGQIREGLTDGLSM